MSLSWSLFMHASAIQIVEEAFSCIIAANCAPAWNITTGNFLKRPSAASTNHNKVNRTDRVKVVTIKRHLMRSRELCLRCASWFGILPMPKMTLETNPKDPFPMSLKWTISSSQTSPVLVSAIWRMPIIVEFSFSRMQIFISNFVMYENLRNFLQT